MGGFVRTKNGLVKLNYVQQHLLFFLIFLLLTPVVTSRGSWPRKEYIDVIAGGLLDLSSKPNQADQAYKSFFQTKQRAITPNSGGEMLSVHPSPFSLPPPSPIMM